MEKNCTNCSYIIPVEGADYGFCNCKAHLGLVANENTVCAEYQEAVDNDLPKCKGCFMHDMITQLEDEAYQRGFSDGCDYTTKVEELAAINKKLQDQVTDLKTKLGCYMVDQEIWLSQNDYLEKENKKLWDSYHKGYAVGYEYGKQDALTSDKAKPKKSKKKEAIPQQLPGQLDMFDLLETKDREN